MHNIVLPGHYPFVANNACCNVKQTQQLSQGGIRAEWESHGEVTNITRGSP